MLLEAAGEVAVLVDVADELVGEEHLPAVEVEQRDLVAQVVGEVARVDRDRLVVLALLVLLAPPARVEAIEKDLLPVDLALLFLLRLGSRGSASSWTSPSSSSSSSGSTMSRNGLLRSSCFR